MNESKDDGATPKVEKPADCVITWTDDQGQPQERKSAHKWEWLTGSFFSKQRCMTCGKVRDA